MQEQKIRMLVREQVFLEMKKLGLFEMSLPKKEVENKFKNVAQEAVEHIFKILIYPSSENIYKWKNEVCTFIEKGAQHTVKGTNKKLNKEVYYKILNSFTETENEFESLYNYVVNNFNDKARIQNIKHIEQPIPFDYFVLNRNKINELLEKISLYISENKVVKRLELFAIINS